MEERATEYLSNPQGFHTKKDRQRNRQRTVKRAEIDGVLATHWGEVGRTAFEDLSNDGPPTTSSTLGATTIRKIMRTLTLILFLTAVPNALAQQVIVIQPRQQSNSLFNPANPNRPWVDYAGKTGRQRAAQTPTQWIATPIPRRFFPLNIPPTYRGPVVILNPYVNR